MHVSLFLWGCVGTLRLQALPYSTPPALSLGKCKLLLPLRRSNCCNCTPAIEDPSVRHTLMKLFNAFKSKVGALNDLSVVKESDGVWRGYRHYLRSTCPRQNHRERESLTPQLPVNSPALLSLREIQEFSFSQTQWLLGPHTLQGHISTSFR